MSCCRTDPGYEAARAVWNGMIDRRPAIVVRPTSAADVVDRAPLRPRRGPAHRGAERRPQPPRPLDLRRRHRHRPGAHAWGHASTRSGASARVNGGALLGELDDAAQAHGLACNSGTVSHTGVAGLTLGGGMGRLQRKLGLTIDALRAVDLVTADGRQVRASQDEHPDLFWGVRGAGANFGIVTAFEFDLAPIGPTITRGVLTYPGERAREVVAAFSETMSDAPDELMASLDHRSSRGGRGAARVAGRGARRDAEHHLRRQRPRS